MEGVVDGSRDGHHHSLGDDAVVGVGDGDGAGVAGKQRSQLGDEKEEAMVVAIRGEDASGEAGDDPMEDGRCVLMQDPPGVEGDAVWAGAGVLGPQDDVVDVLEAGDHRDVLGGNGLLEEAVVGLGGDVVVVVTPAVGPDLGPVSGGSPGHVVGLRAWVLVLGGAEGVEASAGGGEVNLNLVKGIALTQTRGPCIVNGFLDPSHREEVVNSFTSLI